MRLELRRYGLTLWHGIYALVRESLARGVPQLAASLTYFTILSVFPALVIVIALLGMIGLSADSLQGLLAEVAERTNSEWAVDIVSDVLASVLDSANTGVFLGIGVLASLWAASGYVNSFMWAADHICQPVTRRSPWRGVPLRLGLSLLLLVLLTAAVAMVTLIGPLGDRINQALGLSGNRFGAWMELTTPLLAATALLMLTLLFKYAPSRRQPGLWRLLASASLTVAFWVVASLGFSYYLAHFSNYNRVYGALGAAVAFLVWAWMLNLAVLVGVQFSQMLEPAREPPRGREPDDAEASAEVCNGADGVAAPARQPGALEGAKKEGLQALANGAASAGRQGEDGRMRSADSQPPTEQ